MRFCSVAASFRDARQKPLFEEFDAVTAVGYQPGDVVRVEGTDLVVAWVRPVSGVPGDDTPETVHLRVPRAE